MNQIVQITPQFAVTGALAPGDLAIAAGMGFRAVLSNLSLVTVRQTHN